MDLSQLSDADLEALSRNDLAAVSDEGLEHVHAQSSVIPEEPKAEPGMLERFGRQTVENLPMYGAVTGAALGATAGGMATLGMGAIPAGVISSGAGAVVGQQAKDMINQYLNPAEAPKNMTESAKSLAHAGTEGLEQEMLGQAGGVLLHKGAEAAAATGPGKYVIKKAGQLSEGAGKVRDYLVQKFGKVYANVPEEMTKEYIERGGNINARPADEIMSELSGLHDEAQTNLENARVAHESAKTSATEAKAAANDAFADERFQAAHDLGEAKANLERAHTAKKAELESVKSPIELADDVHGAMEDLKTQIRRGSQESYEILDKDPKAYSVRNGAKILRNMADEMNIKAFDKAGNPESTAMVAPGQWAPPKAPDSGPVTAESEAVQGALRSFADRLEATPEMVPARELKKILQQIDRSERAQYGQPGFDTRVSSAYKTIRGVIDDVIKTENPAYAEKMRSVAANTEIMERALEVFGSPQATLSKLNGIGGRTAGPTRDVLQKLGGATGQDFTTAIDRFMENQEILKSPQRMQALRESLPEHEIHQQASRRADELRDPYARRSLREDPRVMRENDLFAKRQMELELAQDKANIMRPLNPQTVQSRMKALTGARSFGAENHFADVDAATGVNYSGEIRDRAILDQFNKTDTQGSRKVAAGAAIGGAIGGFPGAAVGGAMGAVADKYAGQTFKAALDTGIGISRYSKQLGPQFTQALEKAATRGPQALAATHYLLQQRDEDYRKRLDVINQEEDEQSK